MTMKHPALLIGLLAVAAIMNAVAFCLMAYDKKRAKTGKWRVPERTLFLAAACFGGLGGVLGMQLLRHKTQHWYFAVFFPIFLVLQIAAIVAAFYFLG